MAMQTIKRGSRGTAVRTLQTLLGITADGIFGAKTKKAVKGYQGAHGLEADGIVGALTWARLLGDPTPVVANVKPVDYKQYDNRWGKLKYSTHTSKQTIKNSGCGPTAMANIVATWFDPKITPKEMCALAIKGKYRTYNSGTAWGYFKYVFKKYPFDKYLQTKDHAKAIAALAEGALIVASMAPGYWTSGGHFITLWKCDGTYMYANDPASSVRKRQKLASFKKQVKQYFIFWRVPELVENAPETPVQPAPDIIPVAPETPVKAPVPQGIYDISKWQGKVDFAKLAKKAGFLILRSNSATNKDARFDEYANAARLNGIPFGVYCYSYADNEGEARQEARKQYAIAAPKGPTIYFMDAEEARLNGKIIAAYADELRALGCKRIGIYVANHRFKSYKFAPALWDAIWIPHYGQNDGKIHVTPSHRPCDLHQYSSFGRVSGISGRVDVNVIPACGRHSLEWFRGESNE